jgi:hypothetical protein
LLVRSSSSWLMLLLAAAPFGCGAGRREAEPPSAADLREELLRSQRDPARLERLVDPEEGLWLYPLSEHSSVLACTPSDRSNLVREAIDEGGLLRIGPRDRFTCARDGRRCVSLGEVQAARFHFRRTGQRWHLTGVLSTSVVPGDTPEMFLPDGVAWQDQEPPSGACALQRLLQGGGFEAEDVWQYRLASENEAPAIEHHCGPRALEVLRAHVRRMGFGTGASVCDGRSCRSFGQTLLDVFRVPSQPLRWLVAEMPDPGEGVVAHAAEYETFLDEGPRRPCEPR